jgi:hypothetical protein
MTSFSRSNVRDGVSTRLHIAVPRARVARPPVYGASFGLAAILLSLLGVGMANDVAHDSSARQVPFSAPR